MIQAKVKKNKTIYQHDLGMFMFSKAIFLVQHLVQKTKNKTRQKQKTLVSVKSYEWDLMASQLSWFKLNWEFMGDQ